MQASEAKLLATFGRSMRSHRKQRKLSQDDLALAAKLSQNYVSDIERGEVTPACLRSFAYRVRSGFHFGTCWKTRSRRRDDTRLTVATPT